MPNTIVRMPVTIIKKKVAAIFTAYGFCKNESDIIADSFVTADLFGISTHGVVMVPSHIERLMAKGYNLKPKFRVIRSGDSFSVIDGDGSIGALSGHFSMSFAIREARTKGLYAVFSHNNNTIGAAFHYSRMATNEKMIGIVMSNSPPAMAPWGGKDKMLGTNPISIGVPVRDREPILFDMASSQVAKSKLAQALRNNQSIPYGWATDKNGFPTNDPKKGIEGLVLPLGGYKGYGIAMMIDILSGALSGASFLNNVGSFFGNLDECMNVGCLFVVLNPKHIFGDGFEDIMSEYCSIIKNSQSTDNNVILLPGERKSESKKQNSNDGIAVSQQLLLKFDKLIEEAIPHK